MDEPLQAWKTLSRQVALNHGKFLVVEVHEVQLPDGRIISDWPWLVTPDYVIVVAVTEDDSFLLFRQTKYSLAGTSLAPVGGYLEPGEDPLEAAKRELLEETGYEASDWRSLGSYSVDGNRGAGRAHLFLARGACFAQKGSSDDLEEQQLLYLKRSEASEALNEGEFKVLAWAAAVALALQLLSDSS